MNPFFAQAANIARAALPRCMVPTCNLFPLSVCQRCNRPTCIQHGYFNASLRCVCEACVSGAEPQAQAKPPKVKARKEPSPYDILGVHPKANINTIRHAYKAKAAKYHPDGATPNVEKFLQVQRAYEILTKEVHP